MLIPAAIDVVYSEKFWVSFTTALTLHTVMAVHFHFNSVAPCLFTRTDALFVSQIVFVPLFR